MRSLKRAHASADGCGAAIGVGVLLGEVVGIGEVFGAGFLPAGEGRGVAAEARVLFADVAVESDRDFSLLLTFDSVREARGASGVVKTRSNPFDRCSTCALVPGSSWKESTVLSALRCTFTSAKPRPWAASARDTSAAGILT